MPRMPFPRKTVMKHLLLIFAVSYAVCLPASVVADDLQSKTSKWLLNVPKPKPVDPPGRKAIEGSIDRGIDFLLEHQRPNGSWGSATNTKGLNIYAPIPGAHYAWWHRRCRWCNALGHRTELCQTDAAIAYRTAQPVTPPEDAA